MEYRVRWEIDLDAETPEEAAEQASAWLAGLSMNQDGMVSGPSVFDVYSRRDGRCLPDGWRIDLSGEGPLVPVRIDEQ